MSQTHARPSFGALLLEISAATLAGAVVAWLSQPRASAPPPAAAPAPAQPIFDVAEVPEGMDEPERASMVSARRPDPATDIAGHTETCRDCRFWFAENAQAGECRRFAPDFVEGGLGAVWPLTHADAWCGEHLPAAATQH